MKVKAELSKATMFICIRKEGFPRSYPVAKFPDGTIEVVTWREFDAAREAQQVSNN